tara:strand:+ start:372 stop:10103 length:9732 start_codon:yes stop_codon:yes gene_type:complete
MYVYLIDDIEVTFNSELEAAKATLKAEQDGLSVELVSEGPSEGPKTEEKTKEGEDNSIIGKPGFLPDASASADVVSETPLAQNTESNLADGSLGSEKPDKGRYIKVKGQVVYEDDYTDLAGTDNYPDTFEEYAKLHKTEIKLIEEGTAQGGELEAVYIDKGPESYVSVGQDALDEFGENKKGVISIDFESIAGRNGYSDFETAMQDDDIIETWTTPESEFDQPKLITTGERTPKQIRTRRDIADATDHATNLALKDTPFSNTDIISVASFDNTTNPDFISEQAKYLTQVIPQLSMYDAEVSIKRYNTNRREEIKIQADTIQMNVADELRKSDQFPKLLSFYRELALEDLPKEAKKIGRLIEDVEKLGGSVADLRKKGFALARFTDEANKITKNKDPFGTATPTKPFGGELNQFEDIQPTSNRTPESYIEEAAKLRNTKKELVTAYENYSSKVGWEMVDGNIVRKDNGERNIVTDEYGNILDEDAQAVAKANGESLYINNEEFDFIVTELDLLTDFAKIQNAFVGENIKNKEYTDLGSRVFYLKRRGDNILGKLTDPELTGVADFSNKKSGSAADLVRPGTGAGGEGIYKRKVEGEHVAFTGNEIAKAIKDGDWDLRNIEFMNGIPEEFKTKEDWEAFYLDSKKNKMMLPLLTDMYVLGLNPGSGGKDTLGDMLESGFNNLIMGIPSEETKDGFNTERGYKDDARETLRTLNVAETKEMRQSFDRGWGMRFSEGLGAFVPVIGEFAVASYLTAGVGAALGTAKFIKNAFHGGKNIVNASKKAKYIQSFAGRNPLTAKFMGHMLKMGEEEIKFTMVARGDNTLTSGGAFYLGSLGMSKLIPWRFNSKYQWSNTANKITEKFALAGVGGATSSELSHLSEAFYKEWMGDKDLNHSLEEYWGKDADFFGRYSINAAQFAAIGATKFKTWDFKSEAGVQAINTRLRKEYIEEKAAGASDYTLQQKGNKIFETQQILDLGKEQVNKSNIKSLNEDLLDAKEGAADLSLSYSERKAAQQRVYDIEKQKVAVYEAFEKKKVEFAELGVELVFGETKGNTKGEISPDGKKITIDQNKLSEGLIAHEMGHYSIITAGRKDGTIDAIKTSIEKQVEDAIKATQIRGELNLILKGGKKALDAQGNERKILTLQEVMESFTSEKMVNEEYVMRVIELMTDNRTFANALLNRGVLKEIYKSLQLVANNRGISFGRKPININSGSKDNNANDVLDLLYKMANAKTNEGYKGNIEVLKGVVVDGKGQYSTVSGEKLKDQKQLKSEDIEGSKDKDIEKLRNTIAKNNISIDDAFEGMKDSSSPTEIAEALEFMFLDQVTYNIKRTMTKDQTYFAGDKFQTPEVVYETAMNFIMGEGPGGKRLSERAIKPFFEGRNIMAAIKRDNLTLEQTIKLMKDGGISGGALGVEGRAKQLYDFTTGEAKEAKLSTYVNNVIEKTIRGSIDQSIKEREKYVHTSDTQQLEYFAEQMSEYGEGEVFGESDISSFKEAATVKEKDQGYNGAAATKRRSRESAMDILNIKPETRLKTKKIVEDKLKNEPIEGLDAFSVGTMNFGKGKVFDIETPNQPNRAIVWNSKGEKSEMKSIRKPQDIFNNLKKQMKVSLTKDIIDQSKSKEEVAEAKKEIERILNLKWKSNVNYEKDPTRLFRVGLERKAENELYEEIIAEMGKVGSVENLKWLSKARALLDNYIDLSQITKRFDLDVLYEKVYEKDSKGNTVLDAKGNKKQKREGGIGARASGNMIFKKRAISAKEYFEYFKEDRVRQESLAKALAREFAFDQIVDVLKTDTLGKLALKEGPNVSTVDFNKGMELFREDMFKHIRRGADIEKLYSEEIVGASEKRNIPIEDFTKIVKGAITQLTKTGWESLSADQQGVLNDIIIVEMQKGIETLKQKLDRDEKNKFVKELDKQANHFENINKAEFESRQKPVMYLFKELFNSSGLGNVLGNVAKSPGTKKGGEQTINEFLVSRIFGGNDIMIGKNLGKLNQYPTGKFKGEEKNKEPIGGNYRVETAIELYEGSKSSDLNNGKYFAVDALENLKTDVEFNKILEAATKAIEKADVATKKWQAESGRKADRSKITLDYNTESARAELFSQSDRLFKLKPELSVKEHADTLFEMVTEKIGEKGMKALEAEANALQAIQKTVLHTIGELQKNATPDGVGALRTFMHLMANNAQQGYRKLAPEVWYDFNTIYEASKRFKSGKVSKKTMKKDEVVGNEHLSPRAAYFRDVFEAFNNNKLTDANTIDALVGGYESMIGKESFQSLSDANEIPSMWNGKSKINDAPIPFLGKLLISTTKGEIFNEKAWNRVLGKESNNKKKTSITIEDLQHLNNIRRLNGTTALQQWGKDMLKHFDSQAVKQTLVAANKNRNIAKSLGLPESVNGKQLVKALEDLKSEEIEETKSYEEFKEGKKVTDKGKMLEKELASMIARKGGAPEEATVSDSKAFMSGKKRWDDMILPSNSEDLQGLFYKTHGKGKQGDADMAFMKEHILRPLTRAENSLSVYRMRLAEDYAGLESQIKAMGETKPEKEAAKRVEKLGYNIDQAVRVYIWQKLGMKIPGISLSEKSQLTGAVMSSAKLRAYANGIMEITKTKESYPEPSDTWFRSNVQYDLFTHATDGVRADFLYEWQENVDAMFSKENFNKLEARFGGKYRYNLEQMLVRIAKGKSRPESTNTAFNTTLNYINGSVATIMFLNMRSAALQTISAANYVNWSDNNPVAIAKIISEDPKRFIEVAKKIWSSDALRDRRIGLKINVQEAEMAKAIRQGGRTGAQQVWDQMIQIGFKPTQMADSFAITMGGTPFYMNRMKTYEKQGMDKPEAEAKAWEDFLDVTQEGQQSSQMDRVSNIQTGLMGRLVFSFNNTPFQMSRLQKKAFLDLKNNRGDKKTNVSRLGYYAFVQSTLFYGLQTAFYSGLMNDDVDLTEKQKVEKYNDFDKRLNKLGKSVWQGLLTGSGLPGKIAVTGYNTGTKMIEQYDKGYQGKDFFPIISQILSISPTLGSKVNRLGRNWEGLIMSENTKSGREFSNTFDTFDPRNPNAKAYISMIGTATNIPLDRLVTKMENISGALDAQNEIWQRAAMFVGTPKYQLQTREQNARDRQGIIDKFYLDNVPKGQRDIDAIESLTKAEQKRMLIGMGGNPNYVKTLDTQSDYTTAISYIAKELNFDIEKEYKKYETPKHIKTKQYKKLAELTKKEQQQMLVDLGITKSAYKNASTERARVDLIIQKLTDKYTPKQDPNKNKQASLK